MTHPAPKPCRLCGKKLHWDQSVTNYVHPDGWFYCSRPQPVGRAELGLPPRAEDFTGLDYLVAAAKAAENAAVEAACEEALAGGRHGVLVVRGDHGLIAAQVCWLVPYGEVHDVPAFALGAWLEGASTAGPRRPR